VVGFRKPNIRIRGTKRAVAGDDLKGIDLTQYNLYDPKTNANYFKVMDTLRQIPTIGTRGRLETELDKAISNLPQDLSTQVADRKSDILDALVANSALAEQRRAEPSDGKNVVDKAATVVLKQLGYEGVNAAVSLSDPNLQDPDSTGYGTVVFDLKEGTVESASHGISVQALIQNGEITFVDEQGKPCAEMGMRSSFTKGKSWRVVKDLKGYPTHAEGGVDLQFNGEGVKIKKGETTITAKYGLVISI